MAGIVARLVAAIGDIKIQRLRPVHVHDMQLLKRDGSPVAPRTAQQVRRVLKTALQAAVEIELVSRNVAASGKPVAGEETEVAILQPAEIASVLESLRESELYHLVSLALATGMRRGELLALRWQDINGATVTVARSLEYTKAYGYRFKAPKTRAGRRSIQIPPETVDMLRDHRRQTLELRMLLGMGRLEPEALVFCRFDGQPMPATNLTTKWRKACGSRWKFHALRHTHASALIAAGVDVVTVSRRLGHSSPSITLGVYGHLFGRADEAAALAIGKVLGANRVPNGDGGP